MLNHLQAPSRLLVRASIALFTAIVLLLIQSAFWSNRVSVGMQIVIIATAVLSYFRPRYGLLAVAALVPFGRIGSGTLESQMRGAESLVLAFLAGALVRGWTLREFRSFPSTRLELAALIFGFVVAASCLEQLWLHQLQQDFPWPFAREALTYASRGYLTSFRGYGMIFNAMLLLEGLALLCLTVRYANEEAVFGGRITTMILLGALAVVVLTLGFGLAHFFRAPSPGMGIVQFFTRERWAVHITDVNAAGSFFAMTMFIAFGLALQKRGRYFLWIPGGLLLAAAMWVTFSRTALVAVILVAVNFLAVVVLGRIIGTGRAIAVTVTGITGLMIALWQLIPHQYFGAGAETAVAVRRVFLQVTGRMLADYPLFGVGIGQYGLWSFHFAVPGMFEYYQRENAHNNFAQIAGELGLTGLAAFVCVLCAALWFRRHAETISRMGVPLLLGLAAFMLTWLGGHPLLVPEVAFPFWIILGAAAALIPTIPAGRVTGGLIVVALATLFVSVPFRVRMRAEAIDFSRVQYGLANGRITASRARFFVPADRTHVEFPLRARAASDDQPVRVDVIVDDVMTRTVTLTDRNWQPTRIDFRINGFPARFRQLELRVQPDQSSETAIDSRPDVVEVGNWEIITKPNG